jgi:hypothetical protein
MLLLTSDWPHCHCCLGILFADLNTPPTALASSCTPFALSTACLLIPLVLRIHLRAFQARNEPRRWLDMHAVTACFLRSMRPALSPATPSQPPVFLACPPPPPLLLFALILPCRLAAAALSGMVNSDLLLLPAHPCSTPCTTDTATILDGPPASITSVLLGSLVVSARAQLLLRSRASCCSPQVPCVSGAPDQVSDDEVTCNLQP